LHPPHQPCEPKSNNHNRSPVGAVELQRGCDSGVSGTIEVGNAAAIAASPGLDNSYQTQNNFLILKV
ncbi:hypothetical protein J1G35_30710, partial [Pseudomonas sp. SH10-3B]|uniref:hypothetical protein n=1 Tax=Pseudomonas sp. SH10-3B TaxID=2816049 RepID=UPI001CA651DC